MPSLQGGYRVYDETNTLSQGEISQLDAKLKAFEDSTTTQIIVVIIKALGNNEISEYAVEVGRYNKVGQDKKNNGAIVLISKDDRKAWIATGMGLEASLTDLEAGLIYREVLRPGLQSGDFYGAIDSTTSAIMAATAGEYAADPRENAPVDEPSGIGVMIFVIFFFVVLMILRALFGRGHRRTIVGSRRNNSGCGSGLLQGLFWASIFNSGGRRGGWGGGGFGGGGFGGGGFGGGGGGFSGGGGSFGGGGAGGSW